jgi:putative Mg2+ transporter-C (MgtC) family protein
MSLFQIDHTLFFSNLLQLVIAFVLPLMTAWERESTSHSAGLRTFPLVSMAACSFTILGVTMFDDPGAQGRIVGGVVTGIGFIGGGAILKQKDSVFGTSTAAAIWSTGAVGIAVGLGRLEIALALSVMTFVCLKVVGRVKKEVEHNTHTNHEK